MTDLKNTDRKSRQHLLFLGFFLIIEILLIWRSFYGFNTSDEMYFIGTSARIFRGEKVQTQVSGVLQGIE